MEEGRKHMTHVYTWASREMKPVCRYFRNDGRKFRVRSRHLQSGRAGNTVVRGDRNEDDQIWRFSI